MILIKYSLIYSELDDFSTNNVIDWFILYGIKYKRYNGIDDENNKNINSYNFNNKFFNFEIPKKSDYIIKNNLLSNDSVFSIWFRRPSNELIDVDFIDEKLFINLELKNRITLSTKYNDEIFKQFFVDNICDVKLGSYYTVGLNKPNVLTLASKIGLAIPKTLITNSKSKVVEFLRQNNNSIINKALHEAFRYLPKNKNYWVSNKTIEINRKKDIPKIFSVSLFQEKIIKKYEIRTFFINNFFYSACIISQNNVKTELDFRNYDFGKPNRIIPFKLPQKIEIKLIKLMNYLNLNTGSIDLIRTEKGEFVFLEINPVGQYDFISNPCNYGIDYKIFKFLTKKNNE